LGPCATRGSDERTAVPWQKGDGGLSQFETVCPEEAGEVAAASIRSDSGVVGRILALFIDQEILPPASTKTRTKRPPLLFPIHEQEAGEFPD
jgi:hypothetical protein